MTEQEYIQFLKNEIKIIKEKLSNLSEVSLNYQFEHDFYSGYMAALWFAYQNYIEVVK